MLSPGRKAKVVLPKTRRAIDLGAVYDPAATPYRTVTLHWTPEFRVVLVWNLDRADDKCQIRILEKARKPGGITLLLPIYGFFPNTSNADAYAKELVEGLPDSLVGISNMVFVEATLLLLGSDLVFPQAWDGVLVASTHRTLAPWVTSILDPAAQFHWRTKIVRTYVDGGITYYHKSYPRFSVPTESLTKVHRKRIAENGRT